MPKQDFHKTLLSSDEFAQYSLRATFFVRKLRSLKLAEAIHEVQSLTRVSKSFLWNGRRSWGIDDTAWHYVVSKPIEPLLLFAHPRVLSEQPRLLLYYRTVTLVSQKGLSALVGGDVAKVESGKVESPAPDWIRHVAIALNSIASAIIKTSADIAAEDLPGFQFATAGATIQGSWNNSIGLEGEAAIRTILANHLRDEIAQVVWRDNTTTPYRGMEHATLIDRIEEIRVLRLQSGFHLLFASEPDVSMRDVNNRPVVAVEVKAGADPAGALERRGAAMKSFEQDRNLNPRAKTVYVVRCLTPELQRRINQGDAINHTFALSELLVNETRQREFANLFVRVALGKRAH